MTLDPGDRAFRSVAQRILEVADREPGRVVIRDARTELTAAALASRVRRTAADLAAGGVRPGSVVAQVVPVSIDAVCARYALGLLGCSTATCPHGDDPARLADFLRAVAPDTLLLTAETTAAARAADLLRDPPRVVRLDQLPAGDPEAGDPTPGVDPDADSILVTSGGTTGRSKASRHSFRSWLHTVDTGTAPARRQPICTPLAYVAQVHLDSTLLGGGVVVLRRRFDPAGVLDAVESDSVTHLGLVEPLVSAIAEHPDVQQRDLSGVAMIAHIGADAAPTLRRRFLERLGPRLANPYGASEVGIMSVLPPPQYRLDHPELLDTAGRPAPGVELRIEDATGAPVAPGTAGRIHALSAARGQGYRGDADDTAFRSDGWYRTGDIGSIDANGYLRVRGREADARESRGVTFFPVDVQGALCAEPAVAYAVAWPSESGPGFDAAVQLRAGAAPVTAAELRASLPVLPALGELVVVAAVPLTEQGKPDRVRLRDLTATGER